jgi:hypothetical protein
VRWQYRDPALLWLFALAYAAHLTEEVLAGFPRWLALVTGEPLPMTAFVAINAAGMAIVVWAIRAATTREQAGWAGIAVAAAAGVNALAHLAGSLLTAEYSPGLFTGVVLYVPLSFLTLTRAFQQAPPRAFATGLATGAAANVVVFLVASSIARLA